MFASRQILSDPANCQRSLGRATLAIPSSLATPTDVLACTVLDVSLGGARVETTRPIEVGESIWLKLGMLKAFGEIKWSRGNTAGIQFDEKLPKPLILSLRGDFVDPQDLAAVEALMAARDWVIGTPGERSKAARTSEVLGSGEWKAPESGASRQSLARSDVRTASSRSRDTTHIDKRSVRVILCSAVAGALIGVLSVILV